MIKKLFSYVFILIFISAGCKKDCNCYSILKIEYGVSFGECMGYCRRDISITPDKIVFTKSGWSGSTDTRHCTEKIESRDFESLTGKISVSEFKKLDEVIGCPDCADGGAEWIRIVTPGLDKKVTFEYGNEPVVVHMCIGILRDYLKGFDNCN